jgi:hypothetical protein
LILGLKYRWGKGSRRTVRPEGARAAEITSIGFTDNCFGGTATAFSAFEVSAQKGLF